MENTIATAEGAIAQAILRSPENLRGSICLVIGYGKCGRTLAGYLRNMFCRTMVWEKDRGKGCPGKSRRTKDPGGERTSPGSEAAGFSFSDRALCGPEKGFIEIYKEGYMYHRHRLSSGRPWIIRLPKTWGFLLYTCRAYRESMRLRLQGRSWLRPLFGSYQNLCSRRACHGIKRKEDRSGPYRVFLHV